MSSIQSAQPQIPTQPRDLSSRAGKNLNNNSRVHGALMELGELAACTAGIRATLWEDFRTHAEKSDFSLVTAKYLLFHQMMELDLHSLKHPDAFFYPADRNTPTSNSFSGEFSEMNIGRSGVRIACAHVRSAEIDSIAENFIGRKDTLIGDTSDFLLRFELFRTVIDSYRSESARVKWKNLNHPFVDEQGPLNPIKLYSRIGAEIALGGPQTAKNSLNFPVFGSVSSEYQDVLKNSDFATLAVLLIENAVSSSGRISVWCEEAAGVKVDCTTKPSSNPGWIEVRLDVTHPAWVEGNLARHGIYSLAERLSATSGMELKLSEKRDYPEPYMCVSSIEALVRASK